MQKQRLLSLDVLRGITIAGMIMVNNPGSWGSIYAPLRHAEWDGLTPTDLVFPFFMFIMGVSMYISYSKFDFQSLSSTKPVYVENDANCAAWAEHTNGASKGMSNSIMLTLGTGVGGGIILNDKLYKGKSGAAGEMHFKMYPDKRRKCTCGAYDCFEAYASGTGLKITGEEMSKNPDITTYDIVEGMQKGDKLMTDIFNTWQDHILTGLIGLTNLFDPDCIVLSGSMAQFVDTDYLEQKTNEEIIVQPTKVLKATAGNYAGMIGAGLLALGAING